MDEGRDVIAVDEEASNVSGIHDLYGTDIKLAKASPEGKHRWRWWGDQQPDELAILKFFDSESEKPGPKMTGGSPHCSFHLEGTEDLLPRESLEVSVIAFWCDI